MQRQAWRWAEWLTLDRVWALLVPLAALIMVNHSKIRPHDFWWHVRVGQIIAESGEVPSVDLFTYTRAGEPWLYQSWLAELILYGLFRAGGAPLVIFAQAWIMAAAYGLLFLSVRRYVGGASRPASLAVFAAMAMSVLNWGVRPQIFSFLCFGLLMYALSGYDVGHSRKLWLLPFIFAAWANLHGGFVFGLALLGLVTAATVGEEVARERRLSASSTRLLLACAVSALALMVTPAGPAGLARYVAGFFQNQVTQKANLEFMPLSIRELDGKLGFGVMTLFLALLVRQRRMLSLWETVTLLAFGFGALYYRRVLPWLGMSMAPMWGQLLMTWPAGASRGRVRLNVLVLTLLVVIYTLSLPWLRPLLPLPEERRAFLVASETPVTAAEWMCERWANASPRIFNDMGYGSYLEWACPQIPVFIDTRFELFPEDQWRDYVRVSNAQFGWEEILQRYAIDVLMIHQENQEMLAVAAQASPEWTLVYSDDYTLIFERSGRD